MRGNQRLLPLILVVCLAFGGFSGSPSAASAAVAAAPPPQGNPPGGTSFSPAPGTLKTLPTFRFDESRSVSLEQGLQQMSQLEPILRDLQGKLDRSQFDLDALGASLDYDPAKIIAFLRTQIAFEQYPGVLRGEFGTLIGRAGNAYDKALLLRRLLDDAGYETRLVRTTLTAAQARALVAQMAAPRPAASPVTDPATLADIRGRLQALVGSPAAGITDPAALDRQTVVNRLIGGDASLILDGLKQAGVKLGQDGALNNLAKEASDYLWVQYRFGSYDKWIDVHPAFADAAAAPAGLKIEKYYRSTLPDDLYHRVRLQVTIEQKLGDKLIATPMVSNWERKAADLAGRPITFQNQPDNFDPEKPLDTATMIEQAGVFVPMLDGKMADRAFDLRGGTYSVGLLSLGVIGLAQSALAASAALGQATDALGSGSGALAADFMTLTAEWIDYTLVAPGGRETHFRRYVLDRVGEANRDQNVAALTEPAPLAEAAKSLLTSFTIMALPGEYSAAEIAHRAVKRTQVELKMLSYVRPDGSLTQFPRDELRDLKPVEDAILNGAFANALGPNGDIRAYRAEPTLVVYEQGLRPARPQATAYQRVDVLHNARRVFSVKGGAVTPAPAEAVRIGVWETLAERSILRQLAPPSGSLEAIRAATSAGIPLKVLRPGDGDLLEGSAHSAATIVSVQRDLEAGYVIIVPERPVPVGAATGWWRVNPATGETLGITTEGYGDAMVEYAITLLFASIFGFLGYNNCRHAGGSGGCCLAEAVTWAVVGVIVGFGIGEAAGYLTTWGWGFAFLIGDVGLGAGSMFIPSVCGK